MYCRYNQIAASFSGFCHPLRLLVIISTAPSHLPTPRWRFRGLRTQRAVCAPGSSLWAAPTTVPAVPLLAQQPRRSTWSAHVKRVCLSRKVLRSVCGSPRTLPHSLLHWSELLFRPRAVLLSANYKNLDCACCLFAWPRPSSDDNAAFVRSLPANLLSASPNRPARLPANHYWNQFGIHLHLWCYR